MSEHEIYRFLTESERAGEWSFPKTDGTSVISKHGKFWIDTNDLSWHEGAEIPDVEKLTWGVATAQSYNAAHIMSIISAGIYGGVLEDLDAVALFPYPAFVKYDSTLGAIPCEYAKQVGIPIVYSPEPHQDWVHEFDNAPQAIMNTKMLEKLGFEPKILTKMYGVKSQTLKRRTHLDNPMFDDEIIEWQTAANTYSALCSFFGSEIPFASAAKLMETLSYGRIPAADLTAVEKKARDLESIPMMCRFIDFSSCIPAFSAPIMQHIQFTYAIWEKNLALTNLSISLTALLNKKTRESSTKSLQDIGHLLAIDAMIDAYFAGVPLEDICPDWQVTRMSDGQIFVFDEVLEQ